MKPYLWVVGQTMGRKFCSSVNTTEIFGTDFAGLKTTKPCYNPCNILRVRVGLIEYFYTWPFFLYSWSNSMRFGSYNDSRAILVTCTSSFSELKFPSCLMVSLMTLIQTIIYLTSRHMVRGLSHTWKLSPFPKVHV